jgi:hypothetical protein
MPKYTNLSTANPARPPFFCCPARILPSAYRFFYRFLKKNTAYIKKHTFVIFFTQKIDNQFFVVKNTFTFHTIG